MKSITVIADEILAREGGFVDDPDDPGGATNHGITIGTARRLGLDLDHDGDVDADDIRALKAGQARDIFLNEYYQRPAIHRLPEPLRPSVFDMYVNSGANAVNILQRLLAQLGLEVTVDGIIGPMTAKATHRALAMAPDHLADAYGIARRNYYYALAGRRPASRKFARRRDGGKGGWISRAEEFISPKYHLSDAAHRDRVASWE